MKLLHLFSRLIPLFVIVAVAGVVSYAARSPLNPTGGARLESEKPASPDMPQAALDPFVAKLDAHFKAGWKAAEIPPAPPAPPLQVLRRLSLALHGANPSLDEIRQFEADERPDKMAHWTRRMLAGKRFSDYFAERMARAFVGTEGGQFIVYRRGRFVDWLSEQLQKNTPYDQIVRTMISQQGLWTGEPATNFVTAGFADGNFDANKLAGRSVRAFLGQRIDCAQCHDHPFDRWKQHEFEGIAAVYGQVKLTGFGMEDAPGQELEIEDRKTLKKRTVSMAVPFDPAWLPDSGTRRERFAAWVTHPSNRRFERAIANRVWALMFGRGYLTPVDDLADPPSASTPDALDLLGEDFREHGYDLRRLIEVIAAAAPYKLDSTLSAADRTAAHPAAVKQAEEAWALFPLVRLRPEQVIGQIHQSASVQTVDQNSHLFLRTIRYFQENDFVKEYGNLGGDELLDRGGTIPQRLLLMNGKLAAGPMDPSLINSAGRILAFAPTDEKCVETAYLVCLTRRPTPEELSHFVTQLQPHPKGPDRQKVMEDLFWSLFNSTEFSWNH